MELNRRNFIKFSGVTAAGIAVSGLGFDLKPVKSHAQRLKTKYAKETTTICCYCAVGCGAIVHTSQRGDGRVINIEGDPDHVINQGPLCPKGAALKQLTENENRVTNMASVGSAAMDNEECWIYQTLMRSLGLVYVDSQYPAGSWPDYEGDFKSGLTV